MSEGKFTGAIGAIIENTNNGKVLLLRRSPTKDFVPNTWEEVTGRMKQFEDPETTVRREVLEETGISEIEIVKPIAVRHYFRGDEETAENEVLLIIYWCKTTVDQVVISEEHSEYIWFSPQAAAELADYPAVRKELKIFIKESA
jgi:8-oxo-dGTP diphosphatase